MTQDEIDKTLKDYQEIFRIDRAMLGAKIVEMLEAHFPMILWPEKYENREFVHLDFFNELDGVIKQYFKDRKENRLG